VPIVNQDGSPVIGPSGHPMQATSNQAVVNGGGSVGDYQQRMAAQGYSPVMQNGVVTRYVYTPPAR